LVSHITNESAACWKAEGGDMLSMMNISAMVVLVIVGLVFLIGSHFDDRSINWINIALATVCFVGAFLLRPRRLT
jgi:hypothetical protein